MSARSEAPGVKFVLPMGRMKRSALAIGFAVMVGLSFAAATAAHAQDTSELAKAAQNPVADMISLPLQNNTFFGIKNADDPANVLNVQPVIPMNISEDWLVISRAIVPIIYLPSFSEGFPQLPESEGPASSVDDEFGLGDINYTGFLSPANAGPIIWGIGPSINLPTATDDTLGSEKWSAGPSAVVLATPNPWVLGTLVRQLWSFAGESDRDSVNQTLIQPFVNYNLSDGWYLVSSPIITANWEEDSGDRWTVPVGGGFGKIFRIGSQPMNFSTQAFYHVESPEFGPDQSLRVQLQFLFPR
jgi:hypothetical protein